MLYYSVNGKTQSVIEINDRALAYGDGLFTTAKITLGKIEFLQSHLERLAQGCQILKIPFNDLAALSEEISNVAINYQSAVLKVVITAGAGGRGYSRQGVRNAQTIVTVHDMPKHYQDWSLNGINLQDCKIKLGLNPLFKGIKHLNRLEQVLIRTELDSVKADDLLVTDLNGFVVESSCANVFWFQEDTIFTPKIGDAGVLGIYRKQILNFEPRIKQVQIKLAALANVSSMFICNSVMGIIPIKQYKNKTLNVKQVEHFKRQLLTRHLQRGH